MDEIAALLSSPMMTAVAACSARCGQLLQYMHRAHPRRPVDRTSGIALQKLWPPIRPFDNIPIVSYFLLRGRCRACKQPFSVRYPLVEALSGLIAAALVDHLRRRRPRRGVAVRIARFAVYFAFAGVLIVLSFIDFATMRLPDVITLPAIPIFFLSGFAAHHAPWLDRLIGAAAGICSCASSGLLLLRAQREGLGLGDAKLLALIGALLGWRALLFVLMIGPLAGVLISGPIVIWSRRRPAGGRRADEPLRHTQIPFGPFLAGAALLYVFLAPRLFAIAPQLALPKRVL